MSIVKKIDIRLIDPNPFRDFGLNPLKPDNVRALEESYRKNGDFGVLNIRKVGNRYQQAFGHHRLEAMRRNGYDLIDCKVSEMTDLAMVRQMIDENNDQYGNNPQVQLDSVSSLAKLYVNWMLWTDDVQSFNDLLTEQGIGCETGLTPNNFFGSKNPKNPNGGYQQAKQALVENAEIGFRTLAALQGDGGLPEYTIRQKLQQIQAEGRIGVIVSEASELLRAKAEIERKAAEEAEKVRAAEERKRKAAAERKAKAQADRLAKLKAQEEAAKEKQKAMAAKIKAAKAAKEKHDLEVQKAAAQEEANRLERERKAEQEAKRKLFEEEKLRLRREREAREAREAAREAKQAERDEQVKATLARAKEKEANKTLDHDAMTILNTNKNIGVFSKYVRNYPGTFPVQSQKEFVTAMHTALSSDNNFTSRGIEKFLKDTVIENDAALRRIQKQAEAQLQADKERASHTAKGARLAREFREHMGKTARMFIELEEVLAVETQANAFFNICQNVTLKDYITGLEGRLPGIKEALNIRDMAVPEYTTMENTIDQDGTVVNIQRVVGDEPTVINGDA